MPLPHPTDLPAAVISRRILFLMTQRGAELPEAIDAVLGVGTYERIAADLWESLRSLARAQRGEG